MSRRLVIFDLDGTILDTVGGLYTSVNKARIAMGLDPQPEDQIISYIGRGAANLMRQSLACDGMGSEEDINRMMSLFNSDYDENCIDYTSEFPGVREVLETLHSDRILLAVHSNKNDYPTQKLIRHFFPDLFSFVLGRRLDIPRKPEPSGVLVCLGHLSVVREDAIYVGDSVVDIETASNAGSDSISVGWGYQSEDKLRQAGASVIVSSPEELLQNLQK